jgi:type I restriction enzyme M protein
VENFSDKVSFIWSVADLLRGDYKQSEYGKVILPLVVLRRLDCVLAPTKEAVLAEHLKHRGKVENVDPILERITGHKGLFNTSKFDLPKLLDDPNHVADNLRAYIAGYSTVPREVMHRFGFDGQIDRLDRSKLLYLVVSRFCDVDLHPDVVSNVEMGYVYEELIRRFSEQSNETAGEHFTPREVIKLMVNLLFLGDEDVLAKPGRVLTLADPACGTGGMLSVAEEYVRQHSAGASLRVFGQELNDETYATCRADMILKGQDAANIHPANSFTEDGLAGQTFDYLLANPPFGVEWKKVADHIRDEHETRGFHGRFGAGLPRINDGSLLFLQHMLSKMKPVTQGGSRLAIVFNGSPLFTGAAGSGESEIRRWIIENDWLEAVVALPDQLFYNTGISTYFWVLTNRKSPQRRGKVQLIDARDLFEKMRKSLGEKRKQINDDQIAEITRIYADFNPDGERSKVFANEAFGFMRITVERPLRLRWEVSDDTTAAVASAKPVAKLDADVAEGLVSRLRALTGEVDRDKVAGVLAELGLDAKPMLTAVLDALAVRDEDAPVVIDAKSHPLPDGDLRDQENVPLPACPVTFEPDVAARLASTDYRAALDKYVATEVRPFVADCWVDHAKTRIGYELPILRHFFRFAPPRSLDAINADLQELELGIRQLLEAVTE